MWSLAFAEFAAVKLLSLRGANPARAWPWRLAAYLGLWPGMNAESFLDASRVPPRPTRTEWTLALAKSALGATLTVWAVRRADTMAPLLVGWVGMVGLVVLLHFGLFHLLSCAWRRAGITAPPLMRAPLAAVTVAEFWSQRWNVAFAETARRLVFRPLARRHGTVVAGLVVFLVSGLIHESVISVPARGGWGGPTLYFLLQAAGIAVQRHSSWRRGGRGAPRRDRLWTVLVTAGPVPLLFPPAFVERVITPFLQQLNLWLP